jgi:hypothetical protein
MAGQVLAAVRTAPGGAAGAGGVTRVSLLPGED